MAIPLPNTSFKAAVVVTGFSAVAAAAVNFSAPVVSHFVTCYFLIIYDNAVFFLRPPYLYLVINCIIVSIVASSRLQKKPSLGGDPHFPEAAASPIPVPSDVSAYLCADYVPGYTGSLVMNNVRNDVPVDRTAEDSKRSSDVITEKMVLDGGDDRRKTEKPKPRSGSAEVLMPKAEKPPVSARFGQRKAVKASPEGGSKTTALGVSKPRRQDTLETTWRKITEGRSMPLTRHLKKSDTWEKERSHARSSEHDERTTKSENLDDRGAAVEMRPREREMQRKLSREPSPGQEELNRRVEAFIKKFNEEMRLQRLESLAKYQDMVNTKY